MTTYAQTIRDARSAGTTPSQREVANAITSLTQQAGFAPTVRELADHLEVSPTDVYQKLVRLRRDGKVMWKEGKSRTLRVVA